MNNVVLFQRHSDEMLHFFYSLLFAKWVDKNDGFRFIPVTDWKDVRNCDLTKVSYSKADRIYILGMPCDIDGLSLIPNGITDVRFITTEKLSGDKIAKLNERQAHFLSINNHSAASNTVVDASFIDDWYAMHWIADVYYPNNKLFKDVVDAYPKLAEEITAYYNELINTKIE